MTPQIVLDPRSQVPLYRQIAERVEEAIAEGRLRPGARLPPVRELAASLAVARVTVHHAYARLRERGLVDSTVGRGTFVSDSATLPAAPAIIPRPPTEDRFGGPDDLRGRRIAGPLALAEPDPELTPAAEFLRLQRDLADEPELLASYRAVEGERRLREEVARRLAGRGVQCRPDELLITAGSTPALSALVQLLTRPGDRVLVEQSTYFGLLSLLRAADVEPVPVPVDEHGIEPEPLERGLLRERPRFLYTIPTFHNPTGLSMTPERRREVLSIAERYGLSIVEDDVFHELSYDGPVPPPLKAMAPEADVIYVDSFSKCLLPGLRLGFVLPPPGLRRALAAGLEMTTLTTSHLLQRTLAAYLGRGGFDRYLGRVRPLYRDRRDALMDALDHHMPSGVRWTRPAGGLCCWVSLPPGGDYDELAREAARRDVGYAPGRVFDPRGRPVAGLRLCLGSATPEKIDAQMRVLGALLSERLPPSGAGREVPYESVPIV